MGKYRPKTNAGHFSWKMRLKIIQLHLGCKNVSFLKFRQQMITWQIVLLLAQKNYSPLKWRKAAAADLKTTTKKAIKNTLYIRKWKVPYQKEPYNKTKQDKNNGWKEERRKASSFLSFLSFFLLVCLDWLHCTKRGKRSLSKIFLKSLIKVALCLASWN